MAAPRKFPDGVRERAVRLVFGVEQEAGSVSAARRRIGEQRLFMEDHSGEQFRGQNAARAGHLGPASARGSQC
jgi:hypothetical protein